MLSGKISNTKSRVTHEFEFRLPGGRNSDRLDTLLTRRYIVEAQECLMWLHSFLSIFLDYLRFDLPAERKLARLREVADYQSLPTDEYSIDHKNTCPSMQNC